MPLPKDPKEREEYLEKLRKRLSSADHRRKLSIALTGRVDSPEVIAKRAASIRKVYQNHPEKRKELSERAKANGVGKWMKGKKAPGVSLANKRRKGKTYEELYGAKAETERLKRRLGNEAHWEGVPRKERRPKQENSRRYRKWRGRVFERDNWTCQRCKNKGGYLQAHHIKPWKSHPELRFKVSNGQTLCEACHKIANRECGAYRNRYLPPQLIKMIRRCRSILKEKYATIAEWFGLKRHTVVDICLRRNYKDVE